MTPPFPEVLVINLDQRGDRWAAMEETCRSAGVVPTRVPAVEASPGWHGCGYSHLKCIEIAKARDLPWVLILEDDATFTAEAMDRFRELLPYLWANREKWERFNGGPTFTPEPAISALCLENRLLYARGLCAHFNLIQKSAYELILDWDPKRDRMIDVYYFNLEEKFRTIFNSVCTYPHISVQRVCRSDVEGGARERDYSRYFLHSSEKLQQYLDGELETTAAAAPRSAGG